jgi:hypothetical protein
MRFLSGLLICWLGLNLPAMADVDSDQAEIVNLHQIHNFDPQTIIEGQSLNCELKQKS